MLGSAATARPSSTAPSTTQVAHHRRPADGYDAVAPGYDRWRWQAVWTAFEQPRVEAWLQEQLPRTRALDLGTGTGRYLAVLDRLGVPAVGVDASPRMLDEARRRAPRSPLVAADLTRLPADLRGPFDVVVAARVLSHVAEPSRAIDQLAPRVVPGARLLVADVHPDHPYDAVRIRHEGCLHVLPAFKHRPERMAAHLSAAGWRVDGLEVIDIGEGPLAFLLAATYRPKRGASRAR